MRQTQEKEIDGQLWTVSQFSATEGLKLLSRLTKLVGGPLGKAFAGLQGEGSILDAKVDFSVVGDAVGELASRLDEDEVIILVKRLVANARCDGREVGHQFDTLFMGRYATLMKVLGFVIGVNYQIPLADYLSSLASAGEVESKSISKAS